MKILKEQLLDSLLQNYSTVLDHRFHIHFANDDRNFGGHVLDFEVDDVTVEIQNFETFEQHFPVNNKTFTETEIDYADVDAEIREVIINNHNYRRE